MEQPPEDTVMLKTNRVSVCALARVIAVPVCALDAEYAAVKGQLAPPIESAPATELREDQTLSIPAAIETRSCGACYHHPTRRRASRSAAKSCTSALQPSLGRSLSGNPGNHHARKPEIRMVEDIKEPGVET